MFGKKYHTILIMPSIPGKRTLRYLVPVRLWGFMAILLSMLCVLAGTGIWFLHHHEEMNHRCLWLTSQNRAMADRLDTHLRREQSLLVEFSRLREQAAFVRGFLGLQSKAAEGALAQGGAEVGPERLIPGPGGAIASATDPLSSTNLVPDQVGRLGKEMTQIIRTLRSRQEEMECTPSISPVEPLHSWISSPFGKRISPFTGREQFHLGVDIAAWKGTPIMAPAKGKVIYAGKMGPLGLTVKIQHLPGLVTEYGHLLKTKVKPGQHVKRGEVIGYMGDSGRSTGYHLHYGIKRNGENVDPLAHMADWNKNRVLMADVDPEATWGKSDK